MRAILTEVVPDTIASNEPLNLEIAEGMLGDWNVLHDVGGVIGGVYIRETLTACPWEEEVEEGCPERAVREDDGKVMRRLQEGEEEERRGARPISTTPPAYVSPPINRPRR